MKIILDLYEGLIGKLAQIAESGIASSGYNQNVEFCIVKAIEDFIKKYPLNCNECHPNTKKGAQP